MIEAQHTVLLDVPLERAWDYVVDIANWAALMPGLQDYEIVDRDNSRWTLKVGVGGMVRTVRVAVHVEEWAGPERARFSYRLEGDPVEGGGTYTAARQGDRTEIALAVQVVGSGPVAPMWEALGRPVLPTFVKAFAGQLKARIEEADRGTVAGAPVEARSLSLLERIMRWFAGLFRRRTA